MQGREFFDFASTVWREYDPYDSGVVIVSDAVDEVERFGSVDEADNAVVFEEKPCCQFTDRGPCGLSATTDRQQELVLGRGEADHGRLFLAPIQERSQASTELQKPRVVSF